MDKAQTPKMHESTENVPVNVSETCNQLPWERTCQETILAKLKENYVLKEMCILS